MSIDKEIIDQNIEIIIKLSKLIESQSHDLENIGRSYGNSVVDIGSAFTILFIKIHIEHFINISRYFSRELKRDSQDFFFLMPILRVQVETFALLMYIRDLQHVKKVSILLNERFIKIASIYKKDRNQQWEKMYSDEYVLYKSLIDEYKLKIPSNVRDFTRKIMDEIKDENGRLPSITSMTEDLPNKISNLNTSKLFPAKKQNVIYSHLSLYAHGNAMFIKKINREDMWVISINIYLMLFIFESINKDFLNNKFDSQFVDVFNLINSKKSDLEKVWTNRV